MVSKTVVGLIGAPASGKDVLADFLVEERGFRRFAFADRVKEGYYAESGYNESKFKAFRGTELEQDIRRGLWEYSDRMRKQHGELYFVMPVIADIDRSLQPAVVSDVRTPEELEQLQPFKPVMIHVVRDVLTELNTGLVPGTRIKRFSWNEDGQRLFINDYGDLQQLWKALPGFFRPLGI